MKISETIKDISFSDYRLRFQGVICTILDSKELMGFGHILKVLPEDWDNNDAPDGGPMGGFNVLCINTMGIMGIPFGIKTKYNAYVLTSNPTLIEGKIAILVPKVFLSRDTQNASEKNIVSNDVLNKQLTVIKDSHVVSRKF